MFEPYAKRIAEIVERTPIIGPPENREDVLSEATLRAFEAFQVKGHVSEDELRKFVKDSRSSVTRPVWNERSLFEPLGTGEGFSRLDTLAEKPSEESQAALKRPKVSEAIESAKALLPPGDQFLYKLLSLTNEDGKPLSLKKIAEKVGLKQGQITLRVSRLKIRLALLLGANPKQPKGSALIDLKEKLAAWEAAGFTREELFEKPDFLIMPLGPLKAFHGALTQRGYSLSDVGQIARCIRRLFAVRSHYDWNDAVQRIDLAHRMGRDLKREPEWLVQSSVRIRRDMNLPKRSESLTSKLPDRTGDMEGHPLDNPTFRSLAEEIAKRGGQSFTPDFQRHLRRYFEPTRRKPLKIHPLKKNQVAVVRDYLNAHIPAAIEEFRMDHRP